MTRVTILPVPTTRGEKSYFTVAGAKQSLGNTAGEALDALTLQLEEDEASTLVIVQHQQPDALFEAAEQQQLRELMERWRAALDQYQVLPADEQAALQNLIEVALRASATRTAAIVTLTDDELILNAEELFLALDANEANPG